MRVFKRGSRDEPERAHEATDGPPLRLVEAPGDVQRRDEVRTRVAVQVEIDDVYGRRVAKVTDNLSAGGTLLTDADDVPAGKIVPFRLDLRPEGPLVDGQAEVLRVGDDGRRALRFVGIDHGVRDEIARFVFACERTRVKAKRPGA